MQSSAASDPSFKAFLEKLQEQNNRGFVTQLVQLKAERENAGEDNDKREKQLDNVILYLKEVRSAVTGIKVDADLTPLVNIGENQTKLLEELNKEISLTRKLTEGSVEYDKEAAQYRNTSGRDIESTVSGKTSKKGGFIDFETARDTLSGQGKRVREDNAFSLKPISYAPGKTVAAAVGGKTGKAPVNEEEEKSKYQGLFKEIESGFKFFMTDGLSEKPGHGIFQTPSKEVEKKDREANVSSPRQENPEADNVASTGEIQADATKSDLEISKQMLDTTKAQLVELKGIREALAPKTPKDLPKQKSTPTATTEASDRAGGGGFDLPGFGGGGKMGKLGGGLMAAGKAALPYAAAAGVAVAGGAAVDYGLGKLGVGKDKEGNDLKIDTAQDDANWAKMSTGQKIQSGLARGIEKTGSALFLGNMSKEAQATRIKKETDYLNKNTPGAATKEALAAPPPTVKNETREEKVTGGPGAKNPARPQRTEAGVVAFDKAYSEARSDGKSVKESKEIAHKARNTIDAAATPVVEKKSGEEKVTGGPGAKNPVIASTAASDVPTLPVVEKKSIDTAAPGKAAAVAMGAAVPEAAAPAPEPEVKFRKTNREASVIGGRVITGFEGGYKLHGKKEDVEEADAAYNEFLNAADDATAEAAAAKFKTLAANIQSPEYREKMKSISKAQQEKKKAKIDPAVEAQVTGGPDAKIPVVEMKPVDAVAPGDATAAALIPGLAKGGPVEDGADYIVGEKGPELFMPFKDGVVLPNDVSKKIAGGKIPLAEGGVALAAPNDDIDHYNKLSKNAKDYQNLRLQLESLDNIRGPKRDNVFEDISPEVKEKEAKFRKMMADLEKEISPAEKNFVDSALTDRYRPAQSEAELDARGPSLTEKYSSDNTGNKVNKTSAENIDLSRGAASGGSNNTVVSNNVSSNNTTKIVPMKANPRPEYTGSSLDRYTNRISVY